VIFKTNFSGLALTVLVVGFVSLCEAVAATSDASTTLRRMALAVGAHEGGNGRDRLLYASSDAQAFLKTLHELGGLTEDDARLLSKPSRADLRQALQEFSKQVAEARRNHSRVEAVVYYSGHADEKGLLLGEERLDYTEFRQATRRLEASRMRRRRYSQK
jgi:hypothetical protein